MMGTEHEVRSAAPTELDAIATVMRRAFVDDPFLHWVLDRPAVQRRAALRFFGWFTGQLIDQGVTWTVGGGAGPRSRRHVAVDDAGGAAGVDDERVRTGVDDRGVGSGLDDVRHGPGGAGVRRALPGGAAVWALPGQWQSSMSAQARLVAGVGPAVRRPLRVVKALTELEHAHPNEPHLYLALLGVDPALQGTGAGSALIASGLQLADEERWPAYLESSNPRNVNFYARHGFATVGELPLPGGPVITRMWREPR